MIDQMMYGYMAHIKHSWPRSQSKTRWETKQMIDTGIEKPQGKEYKIVTIVCSGLCSGEPVGEERKTGE